MCYEAGNYYLLVTRSGWGTRPRQTAILISLLRSSRKRSKLACSKGCHAGSARATPGVNESKPAPLGTVALIMNPGHTVTITPTDLHFEVHVDGQPLGVGVGRIGPPLDASGDGSPVVCRREHCRSEQGPRDALLGGPRPP